jgi:hypothetical protein
MIAVLMDSIAIADTVWTISATKWLQSRATVEPQQGHDTAIYRGRPQFLLVCSHNPVQS